MCVLHTMDGSITQWVCMLSKIHMCVCDAHNGLVYHTMGGFIFNISYVCVAHNGRVYHTVGWYVFNRSYVCVLHTMG